MLFVLVVDFVLRGSATGAAFLSVVPWAPFGTMSYVGSIAAVATSCKAAAPGQPQRINGGHSISNGGGSSNSSSNSDGGGGGSGNSRRNNSQCAYG